MAWILDLDGVIWLGPEPIAGSAEAVARLRAAGERVCFATNNSSPRLADLESKLDAFGIPAAGDVLTSAMAAALVLERGQTALVCGGPGVEEALERRGVHVVRTGPADAVVVGFHLDFDYGRLRAASDAVHGGAVLIGTNDDPMYPTPEGPIPGGGAILAAVATATGVAPVVAGKPHPPMAALVRELAGDGPHVVVGDRPATDGMLAVMLDAPFALVLSGVTSAGDLPVTPEPKQVAADLATLVDQYLS